MDLTAKIKFQFDSGDIDKSISKYMPKKSEMPAKEIKMPSFWEKMTKPMIKDTGAGGILNDVLGAISSPLGLIAAGIGFIVSSSKMLQGSIGNIIKNLQLIIRPLGDILAVGLMPIAAILRPIGMFFNIFMKPYIQKATAAMRAGEAMLNAGDFGGALTAFTTGAEYLLKPMMDMQIKVFSEMMGGLADVMGTALGVVVPWAGDAFKNLGASIRAGGQSIIDTTTNMLDNQLGSVLAHAESSTGKSMTGLVKSLNDADIAIGYLSGSLKKGMSKPFEDINNWIVNDWGTEFTSQIKKIFKAAEVAQLYTPPAATVKYASSASGITNINSMIDNQVKTAQNAFLGGWSNIATSTSNAVANNVSNNVSNAFSTALGNIATGITSAVTGIMTGANFIGGTIFNLLSGQFAHGGTVSETGLYQLHEGETVTTPGASFGQPVNISLNPSYSITTTKSSDEIRRIVEDVSDSKYRELVSRLGG
jgi:hypothetical protein